MRYRIMMAVAGIVVAFAAGACAPGGPENTAVAAPLTTIPAVEDTSTEPPTRDDATVDARDFQVGEYAYAFVSPSGNLYCAIRTTPGGDPAGDVGCQAITSVPASNGTVCDNSATSSYAVRIFNGAVEQFCTNQGIYTGGERILEYGQPLIVQSTVCRSETIGVTCWGDSDNGFTISRDVNTAFTA